MLQRYSVPLNVFIYLVGAPSYCTCKWTNVDTHDQWYSGHKKRQVRIQSHSKKFFCSQGLTFNHSLQASANLMFHCAICAITAGSFCQCRYNTYAYVYAFKLYKPGFIFTKNLWTKSSSQLPALGETLKYNGWVTHSFRTTQFILINRISQKFFSWNQLQITNSKTVLKCLQLAIHIEITSTFWRYWIIQSFYKEIAFIVRVLW